MRGITSGLFALLLAAALVGCSASADEAVSSRMPARSGSPTATAAAPTPTPTPTPTATSPDAASFDDGDKPGAQGTSPQTTPPAAPVLPAQPALDPNAVDPADYPSHAYDTVNNAPLNGVEFQTADGNIICGIKASVPQYAGFAACTPSTWKDIVPSPPPGPPSVHAVELFADSMGALWLYPDLFSQPARTIPVLPDGKSITLETITCSASGNTITCTNFVYNKSFTVSTAAITMHN